MNRSWLDRFRRLHAIAQSGLTYGRDAFDLERYAELQALSIELLAELGGGDVQSVAELFAADSGYATPKLDVRAVVLTREGVLLVRERSDGLWTLPGGWADVGSSPREAVEKEVLEESGYRVRARRLLAVYDRDRQGHPPIAHHVWKVFLQCELLGGDPTTGVETSEVGFFPPDSLPPLSLSRVTERQIARMVALAGEEGTPAEFD